MKGVMVMQGREVRGGDIDLIRSLLSEHPGWGRTRLSEEVCRRWDWRNGRGQIKDMAARTLLLSTLAHKFDHVFCTRSLGCGWFAFEMLSRHLCQKTVQILFGEVPFEWFGDCLIVGLETR